MSCKIPPKWIKIYGIIVSATFALLAIIWLIAFNIVAFSTTAKILLEDDLSGTKVMGFLVGFSMLLFSVIAFLAAFL